MVLDEYALELPEPSYSQQAHSSEDVESLRATYQGKHTSALGRFRELDAEYSAISQAVRLGLDDSAWSSRLERLGKPPTTLDRVRGALSRVGLARRQRPLAEELESQLESVQERIHQVVRLRDSLERHIVELEEDIRRLNRETLEAAQNEELAAAHVLALSKALDAKELALLHGEVSEASAEQRKVMGLIDELKAQIRLHGGKARAYDRAEKRLASIVDMNRKFLEMLKHTGENMDQLVGAASQVVDEISGNVRALAGLTLAGEVATDLMEASRRLREGVNEVAQAASHTSLTLTRDIDQFVQDMAVYDQETVDLIDVNLSEERRLRQAQVESAIAYAYEKAT